MPCMLVTRCSFSPSRESSLSLHLDIMLDLVCQGLQCIIPFLRYHTVLGSSPLVVDRFRTEWLLTYPCQRSYDSPSNRHRYHRACIRRARVVNIQGIRLEGVQVPGGRSADQADVCRLSDLSMSRQVRRLLLGWLLRAIHLPSARSPLLGVLCHLCGPAVIHRSTSRGSSGGSLREQVDDDFVHLWLCWCNDILFLQGTRTTLLSSVFPFSSMSTVRQSYYPEEHAGVCSYLGVTNHVW